MILAFTTQTQESYIRLHIHLRAFLFVCVIFLFFSSVGSIDSRRQAACH